VACYDGDLAAVAPIVAAGADMNRILGEGGSLDLKVSFSVLGRRSLHFRVRQINRTRSDCENLLKHGADIDIDNGNASRPPASILMSPQ